MKIFYSWQSDLPNKYNRGFIDDCIKRTVKKYKNIITIEADREMQKAAYSRKKQNKRLGMY